MYTASHARTLSEATSTNTYHHNEEGETETKSLKSPTTPQWWVELRYQRRKQGRKSGDGGVGGKKAIDSTSTKTTLLARGQQSIARSLSLLCV